MAILRKESRYYSKAQIYSNDILNDNLSLKNLSKGGLCIRSNNLLNVDFKTRYIIDLFPETELNIGKIELEVESKWVRIKKAYSESGFVIVDPRAKKDFEYYMEYLSKQEHLETNEEKI
ncbi:MAG: hypothetical protein LBQ88_06455 [Treponema sp.]|jgi:hypothetical protein|nr:hypothetical protein [Treponema sp.]